jgi:hypothetical protein
MVRTSDNTGGIFKQLCNTNRTLLIFADQVLVQRLQKEDHLAAVPRALRHLSEQYLTLLQSRSHFLRHVNVRPQLAQTLLGRVSFFCMRIRDLLKPLFNDTHSESQVMFVQRTAISIRPQ